MVQIDQNADRLLQDIRIDGHADETVERGDDGAALRQVFAEFIIDLGFVSQAAHESPAASRDLRGIQRKVLRLRHLDRDRGEFLQIQAAAERAPAGAHTAQHPGLVAHADLAQFDAHMEFARQVLDQLAEIHAPFRREIKDDPVPVETAFDVDQLHVQFMRSHLLHEDGARLALLRAQFGVAFDIFFVSLPHQGLQLFRHQFVRKVRLRQCHRPELQTFLRLGDHTVVQTDVQIARIEIPGLPAAAKSDSYDSFHLIFSFRLRSRSSMVSSLFTFAFRRVCAFSTS